MSSALPSAEVAADFKDALGDLRMNSRPEISTLTIIAKENTEHAQAISRELENHIRTTRPDFKLPALYVLDSIVKNVGSPYTVYLGRNLFKTFMDAYSLMDSQNRKAMEGLLKTWKQPVPESLDTRPVFPADVTKEIETALIRFRTAVFQNQQQQARTQRQLVNPTLPRPPAAQWRDTPTPPNSNVVRYAPPATPPVVNPQFGAYNASSDPRLRHQPTPQQVVTQYPSNGTPVQTQNQHIHGYPSNSGSLSELDKLNDDIEKLIAAAKAEWVTRLHDQDVQKRLKALLDLQTILKTQQLPPEQLKLVQLQVAQLRPPANPTPLASSTPVQNNVFGLPPKPPTPQTFQPAPVPVPTPPVQRYQSPQPPVTTPQLPFPFLSTPHPPPAPGPPPLLNLAQILSLAHANQQATPVPIPSLPVWPPLVTNTQVTPIPPPSVTPIVGENPLLAQLRAAGLLPATPTPPPTNNWSKVENDVEMTTASITKTNRPHLINLLYGARPNQCSTCGRRFPNTPEGREMKTRHMDWHFNVNNAKAENRAVHRSWYIGEREWIRYREEDEAAPPESKSTSLALSGQSNGSAPKIEPKDRYVRIPTDVGSATCPICQEKFISSFHNDDWVWMDAVDVGGRIYHATCYHEVTKDGGGASTTAPGRGTPDSALGKRKAGEHDLNGERAKFHIDSGTYSSFIISRLHVTQ
ncbi:hypothetical protein M501DRAFT_208487 [Patellaria atrata CBS 101060]|uniref:CID domain-containing protein n=1 Tax=Patellaria atrata CBS 101060 TaxID=1346257 RepID=A0A9P4VPN6_9PEZI|nr:hypothetical protein M501DRAFT_208487 [Patellaria atrata CBS 101060]